MSFYIVIQNGVGVALATALGLDPLLGLIAGSITLSGMVRGQLGHKPLMMIMVYKH